MTKLTGRGWDGSTVGRHMTYAVSDHANAATVRFAIFWWPIWR